MSVKIPFINTQVLSKPDTGFLDMIRNRICPNFQIGSLTSALIGASIFVFILSRTMYSPSNYTTFLQSPKQVDKFALDVELNKQNKMYYYQTLTALFLQQNYQQIISTVIFSFFVLYELEFCWRLGIILSLVAGFAANSLALATIQGITMGFNGVLCAAVGIQLAALLLHCSYLRSTYGNQFYMIFFFSILMVIMVMSMAQSALIPFFGLFYGVLFGLTLYPRMPEVVINENIDKLLKIFSVAFLGLAVFLGLIV